jgi:hypothetical protein
VSGDHRHTAGLRAQPVHDLAHHDDRLCRHAVQVGHAVALGDRDRNADLVHAGVVGVLRAAQVGDECLHDEPRDLQALFDHLGRVGELRDHAGRDEAADLDLMHASGGNRPDPAHLCIRGHACLGDLQAVAGADFADGHMFCHGSTALLSMSKTLRDPQERFNTEKAEDHKEPRSKRMALRANCVHFTSVALCGPRPSPC